MSLFDRFKKFIACAILIAFIPSQAWAQGITIPAGSSLNIRTAQLTVPGNISNAGTLSATTGTINLNGNWVNSGTFNSGTGTVNFNATSSTQSLNSGGTTDAFYNLTHTTNSTVSMAGHDIDINNNFTNTTATGLFTTNNFNMTVDGNWDNTSASTFTPGTDTVTLGGANGSNQQVLGTTTFYNFSKINTAAATLTFDASGTQSFSHSLTMQGASATNLLSLRSTTSNTQAKIYLSLSGAQSIDYVDVKDSNAGVPASQQTLVGRNASAASATQNNTNWDFNNATLTWTGAVSSEWNNVGNWSPMVVPAAGDTVIIPGTGTAPTQPNLCPATPVFPCPSVSPGVTLGDLTLQANATLTLNGIGLTVSAGAGTFINKGTVILKGSEAVSLTQDTTNPGTFIYQGTGTGVNDTLLSSYYNLVINDVHTTRDTYITAASTNLTAAGTVTITSGTVDISTNTDTLTAAGLLSLNGANATLTATNGNIAANGGVSITAGTFTAPGTGKSFTVGGNFTNTAGNFVAVTHTTGFNNSSGTVTLNGTNQTVSGTNIFYGFNKTVSSGGPYTLTFDSTSLQEFTNSLTLQGTLANNLLIRSTTASQASIALSTSGTQSIKYVNVLDSNAAGIAGFTGQQLIAFNSVDAPPTGTNTNWVFAALAINAPADGTTIGRTPTLIGVGPPNTNLFIKGIYGSISAIVATVKTDANGVFRVVVGQDSAGTGIAAGTVQLDLGANSLTPYVTTLPASPGAVNAVTVVTTPTTNQVPSIAAINGNAITGNPIQFISGGTPTITGQGLAGQPVTVQAIDSSHNLLLTAGSSTVAAGGSYSVTLTTALPSATNFLSVTVGSGSNETTSVLIKVSLTDPFGVVYNSTTNQPIQGAIVTLYDASTKQVSAEAGLQSCNLQGVCTSANPFTTGSDGFYSFLVPTGQYYLNVSCLRKAEAGDVYAGLFVAGEPAGLRYGQLDTVVPEMTADLVEVRIAGTRRTEAADLVPGKATDTGVEVPSVASLYRLLAGQVGQDSFEACLTDVASPVTEGSKVFHERPAVRDAARRGGESQ